MAVTDGGKSGSQGGEKERQAPGQRDTGINQPDKERTDKSGGKREENPSRSYESPSRSQKE